MSQPKFVFLHVGEDLRPALLVKSVRAVFPDAEIMQCTDYETDPVEGVTSVHRFDGDVQNLMTFRLMAFSRLELDVPAIYLDTDVLILSAFDIDELLQGCDVAVCRRSFANDALMNTSFRGMDLSRYAGMTLGEVYPYLACFTVTRNSEFWDATHERLLAMEPLFHYWYGDQEAIREVIRSGLFSWSELAEAKVACLPEHLHSVAVAPNAIHFKGAGRKKMMLEFSTRNVNAGQ